MSLSHQRALYKDSSPLMIPRLRPVDNEGRYIRARAICCGTSLKKIADNLKVSRASVHYVVYGYRRSTRIKAEIARLLGKADWNEVVLEARSEVQKKPVAVILKEMRLAEQGRTRVAKERMGKQMAQRRAEELGWDQPAAVGKRRGA